MQKSLYDVLGVAKSANQELIDHAYMVALKRVEAPARDGDAQAKNDLVALNEAYRVVGNAERRSLYDEKLALKVARPAVAARVDQNPILDWWEDRKTSWLLIGGFLLAAFFIGRHYYVANEVSKVKQAEIAERADVERGRVANERELVTGVVANQAAAIDNNFKTENRQIGISESAEARHSRELEYRANAGQQILDMQQRAQDAQLANAAAQQAQQARRAEQAAKQAEQAAVDRQLQYYKCINAESALAARVNSRDTYGVNTAELRCSYLR